MLRVRHQQRDHGINQIKHNLSAHPMTTPIDPRFCWCWIGVMTFTKMKSTVLLLQYSHEYMSSNSVCDVARTSVFDCL
eukprot:4613-Heterococcus_DN1.PRE.1